MVESYCVFVFIFMALGSGILAVLLSGSRNELAYVGNIPPDPPRACLW